MITIVFMLKWNICNLFRSDEMDMPLILIIIGLIAVIASFFIGKSNQVSSDELEKVSISLHQETNSLKKRMRAVEEELMIGIGPMKGNQNKTKKGKPIHEIIVNQILSLNSQGFSVDDIAKRASLSTEEVISVLQSRGVI